MSYGQPDQPRLCLVHLARAQNGVEPLRSFLASYREHPAGVDHELLIVFKGFRKPLPPEYEWALAGLPHSRRFVDDRGLDVDVYVETARAVPCDVFCFVNSYSVILVDDWLRKLHDALQLDGVGLVGASGTWQSHFRSYFDPALLAEGAARRPNWKKILLRWFPWLKTLRNLPREWHWRGFKEFPNYHVRTNAFMLRRDTAVRIHLAPTRSKTDAYLFESGRRGLTNQVLEMSMRALIVDADGKTYEMPDWHASNTFWRGSQERLLVADNQSRAYDNADPERRRDLSMYAWGPEADSTPTR